MTDDGAGIEASTCRLFERFYRVDAAAHAIILGGAGLGLAIVKHLVESMDGAIAVESTVGTGTTFRITLLPTG